MNQVDTIVTEYLSRVATEKESEMINNMIYISEGNVSSLDFLAYKTKDNTWQDVILKVCDDWGTGDYEDFMDYIRAEGADCFYTED